MLLKIMEQLKNWALKWRYTYDAEGKREQAMARIRRNISNIKENGGEK